MRKIAKNIIKQLGFSVKRIEKINSAFEQSITEIHLKYADFTMINKETYLGNLRLCDRFLNIEGDIVECGVWRGGMIAGIAEMLGRSKKYYLFDSFEGLPSVKEIDGKAAAAWQKNTEGENYHNNCTAEVTFATKAMKLADVDFCIKKGWFNETLHKFQSNKPISILRLDGDWYDSTMDCLKHLFPKLNKGGLIILDDYHTWDGCSRAVHDYLSEISSISRVFTSPEGVCYIIKNDEYGTA